MTRLNEMSTYMKDSYMAAVTSRYGSTTITSATADTGGTVKIYEC